MTMLYIGRVTVMRGLESVSLPPGELVDQLNGNGIPLTVDEAAGVLRRLDDQGLIRYDADGHKVAITRRGELRFRSALLQYPA